MTTRRVLKDEARHRLQFVVRHGLPDGAGHVSHGGSIRLTEWNCRRKDRRLARLYGTGGERQR